MLVMSKMYVLRTLFSSPQEKRPLTFRDQRRALLLLGQHEALCHSWRLHISQTKNISSRTRAEKDSKQLVL